jgi:hypothetical protein
MASSKSILIIVGGALMTLAFVMAVVGAGVFTMTEQPGRLVGWAGYIGFWYFIPTGLLGLLVLIVGLVKKRR